MSKSKHKEERLLLYPGYMLSTNSSGGNNGNIERPESNQHSGYLSANGAKRLRKAVSWLHAGTPDHIETNPDTGKEFTMRLNFITLTLSAEQQHTDTEIKAEMLDPWLDNLRKRYKLKAYCWRAEAQKNGNIHFHVVTNRFMNMYVIRRLWNRRQLKLGYIERYRNSQQAWHKHGFRARPWLYDQWPQDKQYRAWQHGLSTNWNDPNSTDVHSLSRVKNVAAYISKYMTKEGKAACKPCKKEYYFSQPFPEPAQCPKCGHILNIERDRPIDGRLWFVSRSLSGIEPLKLDLEGIVDAELYANTQTGEVVKDLNDFVTIYLKSPDDCTQFGSHVIRKQFREHIAAIRERVW